MEYPIHDRTEYIVMLVSEFAKGVANDVKQAMDMLYNSETYDKMTNRSSWLAYQHPGYVYNYLQEEFSLGRL